MNKEYLYKDLDLEDYHKELIDIFINNTCIKDKKMPSFPYTS